MPRTPAGMGGNARDDRRRRDLDGARARAGGEFVLAALARRRAVVPRLQQRNTGAQANASARRLTSGAGPDDPRHAPADETVALDGG